VKYFKERRTIEIVTINGLQDTGTTMMMPFVDEDFGMELLRYKDEDDTWHGVKLELIAMIRSYKSSVLEERVKEFEDKNPDASRDMLKEFKKGDSKW
jgi:hypothetical protein